MKYSIKINKNGTIRATGAAADALFHALANPQADRMAPDSFKSAVNNISDVSLVLYRTMERGKSDCINANLAFIESEHAALEAVAAAWAKFKAFYFDDLAKNNKGFMGKLVIQDYGAMNDAYIATEKADAMLAAIRWQKEGGK